MNNDELEIDGEPDNGVVMRTISLIYDDMGNLTYEEKCRVLNCTAIMFGINLQGE